jgi:hypothetical protein
VAEAGARTEAGAAAGLGLELRLLLSLRLGGRGGTLARKGRLASSLARLGLPALRGASLFTKAGGLPSW